MRRTRGVRKASAISAKSFYKSCASNVPPGKPGEHRQLRLEAEITSWMWDYWVVLTQVNPRLFLKFRLRVPKSRIILSPRYITSSKYGKDFVVADIPGLIEGASEGVGLGHSVLKHLKRTHIITHIDVMPVNRSKYITCNSFRN